MHLLKITQILSNSFPRSLKMSDLRILLTKSALREKPLRHARCLICQSVSYSSKKKMLPISYAFWSRISMEYLKERTALILNCSISSFHQCLLTLLSMLSVARIVFSRETTKTLSFLMMGSLLAWLICLRF